VCQHSTSASWKRTSLSLSSKFAKVRWSDRLGERETTGIERERRSSMKEVTELANGNLTVHGSVETMPLAEKFLGRKIVETAGGYMYHRSSKI